MIGFRRGGSTATRPVLYSPGLLVVVALAACSGGSTGPTPSPPPPVNAPPVVSSISVSAGAPRIPSQYASLGDTVNVTATVTDAETPVSQLTYEWSSSVGGTFSGNSASVTWTAPASVAAATPFNATLTLTVIERFGTNQTNRVTATSTVDLHNSPKEVGDLARQFLEDFSRQVPPEVVIRNFSTSCPGTANEYQDVVNQQNAVTVISWDIDTPVTDVPFGGTCPFIGRNPVGDACSRIPVRWVSRIKSTGQLSNSSGIDQVTAVLENGRWRLCASDYSELSSTGASLLKYWSQIF